VEPLVTPATTAPPQDAPTTWTVEPGDSLWEIAQEAYGVSETGAIVSMVNLVFDSNRDQLIDPNVLNVGVVLQLPQGGA
jgi:nucleoid-associated protein YgaU